ncbi:hypothetical protein LJB42_001496 [Komagataella kurtzmanii]|nr:hypothetical protein LJB42_001496 [Komagataella kurtzmanii]
MATEEGRNELRSRMDAKNSEVSTFTTNNSDDPSVDSQGKVKIKSWFWSLESLIGPLLITALAIFLRVYQIGKADRVVWDEAHFGKFGSFYLKHQFYFDVHPPLGKLLTGLAGHIAGYNGSFEFKSGVTYPEYLDFKVMRIFNAVFSALCAPVAYWTAKSCGYSLLTVYLISLMVVFENSYVVLGKFILLDSMLLFFTTTTFLGLSKVHSLRQQGKELTYPWCFWLTFTGLSIGCVCSVKLVGLFVTALVGLYTILDLAVKRYDENLKWSKYLTHWAVRILTLIILPFAIYMLSFKIHFAVLYKNGDGASSMSTLFQSNLEGTKILIDAPRDVAYGSELTIRSQGLSQNLLHSHGSIYPEGSNQQQVTTYGHRDNNNQWIVHYPVLSKKQVKENDNSTVPEMMKDGDTIRLRHQHTGANLHSHRIQAHVSKQYYEVSCYGNAKVSDGNDEWVVEVAEQIHSDDPKYAAANESDSKFQELLHPISTSFRLRHKRIGCYLATTGMAYPSWGFKQGEVVCRPSWTSRDKSTWWNIEDHKNKKLPNATSYKAPKSYFWRDFVMLNYAMLASNNALVPDPDKFDKLASQWWQWPIINVGLRMCGWSASQSRYFLMSSPFNTWLSTASLAIFCLILLILVLQWQRQRLNLSSRQYWELVIKGFVPFFGWALHFAPFIVMQRVTYVHHYVPALYFAMFLLGFTVDYLTAKRNSYIKTLIYFVFYTGTIYSFYYFSPLSFGMDGPLKNYAYLQWFKSWTMV